ncbi:MAG: hypothetical protein K6T78_14615 [Alicyclobacillus sp.]|nr:hypothetical protein [Alicyclobacillus sp.]
MRRFQTRSRVQSRRRMMFAVLAAVAAVGLVELYRWVIPFHPLNPLWQEATIGEQVIGDWRYGGQDAEGYLRFYNDVHTVLLPPNDRLFDADGWFVVIEEHTPSSIVFAQPYNAIPLSWLAAGCVLAAAPVVYVVWRRRSGKPLVRRRSPRRMVTQRPTRHLRWFRPSNTATSRPPDSPALRFAGRSRPRFRPTRRPK